MARTYFTYTLETLEPLTIGIHSQAGNLIETCDYIPGSRILGLFASLYLHKNGSAYANGTTYKPDFKALFLDGNVHFSNAYPVHPETNSKTIPMPLTVFGCKYFGRKTHAPEHGVIEHGIIDTAGNNEVIYPSFSCHEEMCPDPRMQHKEGYLYKYESVLYNYLPARRNDTHINVDEAHLFSQEAIEKNTLFHGYISLPENLKDASNKISELIDLCQDPNQPIQLSLGKTKERGNGAIFFQETGTSPPFGNAAVPDGNDFFTVYCYSDIILKNHLGQFYSHIPPEKISTGLVLMEDYSYWKTGEYRGFNQKRKMPLEKMQTIMRGSVFTYMIDNQNNLDFDSLPLVIGEMNHYGFGRLIYNHQNI